MSDKRYHLRGVSSQKEDVHKAIQGNRKKGGEGHKEAEDIPKEASKVALGTRGKLQIFPRVPGRPLGLP